MEEVQDKETQDQSEDEDDLERSPFKKRPRSSKAASRRRTGKGLVSPTTKQESILQATPWTTFFLDTFIYPHSQVILELAVTLKSDKTFEEFTKALMAFIMNAHMVDSKFVINQINPNCKEKNITFKGKISPNMSKLGTHIKISGNGNAFNKQKVWDKDGDSGRQSRKANKKEEFRDPTVYFSMAILSKVDPKEIIECTAHEWSRINGMRLQIKNLQFMESETIVSIYKVLKNTPKDVILKELERILIMTQEKAKDNSIEVEVHDFSMDIDIDIGKTLPTMNL
jgi:hypothetical protein